MTAPIDKGCERDNALPSYPQKLALDVLASRGGYTPLDMLRRERMLPGTERALLRHGWMVSTHIPGLGDGYRIAKTGRAALLRYFKKHGQPRVSRRRCRLVVTWRSAV